LSAARRAVFLDRDGVLNGVTVRDGVPHPPASVADLTLLPGVVEALDLLASRGLILVVVTNQPDVARGVQSRGAVEAIHQSLMARLPLRAVATCLHDDVDDCACRKPRPGLLRQAATDHGIDLGQSFLVGDRWSDIAAGRAAGCTTFLVRGPHSGKERCTPDHEVADLAEAARAILESVEGGTPPDAPSARRLRVKVFADGADLGGIREMAARPGIAGFTTNPTLMRRAGVTDYEGFARDAIAAVGHRPISFEVFSDEWAEMERQARRIASWGESVYVKIPVTNTRGESAGPLLRKLSHAGIELNVTGVFTLEQVEGAVAALAGGAPAYISVLAGRLADTGRDPLPLMTKALERTGPHTGLELIWASPREILNVFQADAIGCPIITVTNDLLKKLEHAGKDPAAYSLETVRMFWNDGREAGYRIDTGPPGAWGRREGDGS
jgi:transaldolase